jgi:dTDP-4-dehydrorhamnose 3,5-epimerase
VRLSRLEVEGAWLIELDLAKDERGFFARCFDEQVLSEAGIPPRFPQWNLSRNHRRGTLRGMHFCVPPSAESKIVRCVRGRVYDVIADVRRESPTYLRWTAIHLSDEEAQSIYIPAGVAHGFLTLADGSDVLYQMADVYRPELARGFRWNDAALSIAWPSQQSITVVSDRDSEYPDFSTDRIGKV